MANTATFDAARLNPQLYNLTSENRLTDRLAFQQMVEDFVQLAETNPTYFDGKEDLVRKFINLVRNKAAFPHAQQVVPELRMTKGANTAHLNRIMKSIVIGLEHLRPPPPLHAKANRAELRIMRDNYKNVVDYLVFDRDRTGDLEAEREADEVGENALGLMRYV